MADDTAAPFDDAVLLAAVLSAHGLKGEVKLKLFTENAEALRSYGVLTTNDGREIELTSSRAAKGDEIVAQFKGFSDRDGAESLKGQRLFVPRSVLPPPEEEEFYHADLIGLRAKRENGSLLGSVVAIHNFGAGDVIEIVDQNSISHFISFTREAVPLVDLEQKRIIVAMPLDEE
jgi:16S rRNA processing protein RimM